LYRSPDLVQWTYLHPLYRGKLEGKSNPKSPVASGEMWECPSFFRLGDKYVLFVSTEGTTPVYVGSYRDQLFEPERSGRLDCGDYYAPITQVDENGRRILWGWIQERRSTEAQVKAGWSGVLSLPRVLSIREDGSLGIEPAPQCRGLRGVRQHFVNIAIPDNRLMRVPGVSGDGLELIAEFDPGDAEQIGLRVLEDIPVLYDLVAKRVIVGSARAEAAGQFVLAEGEPLRLHVFVDCSVIEVFFNGRACYTGRAYPDSMQQLEVSLLARGGSARLKSLVVYEMKPISNDRMTS
jgi:beta-fructofuranosidase